jgi:hypothetical protein
MKRFKICIFRPAYVEIASYLTMTRGEGYGIISIYFPPPSVEQLRMKAGKTMVALCVMAGHSRFLQKRKG